MSLGKTCWKNTKQGSSVGGNAVQYLRKVTIVRSSDSSNLPHIIDRISSHRRALFGVLPAGLAKKHNANPAASLRVQNVYALSVLLSGLASIPLTNPDIAILEKHYKNMLLRCIMKLPEKCPDPVHSWHPTAPLA